MLAALDLVPDGVTGLVACGDTAHEVAWTGSRLAATGHEPTEEDILDALGGHRPACVQLTTTWEAYKLEPLLIGALLTGHAGLLSRQSQSTVGPRVSGPPGSMGMARLLQPFLALPSGLRRVLAADAAGAYSRTELLTRGMSDDTSALRTALRRLVTDAAEEAFDRPVEVRQLRVTNDGPPPALFVRSIGPPVLLTGQLPVSWAALAALGLAARPGMLVVGLDEFGAGGIVRASGYSFGWRDADLTPACVEDPADDLRANVRAAVAG